MSLNFEEVKAAAEGGNARAMGILAANYVEQDEWGEAVHWFIAAADNGDEISYSPAARSCFMDAMPSGISPGVIGHFNASTSSTRDLGTQGQPGSQRRTVFTDVFIKSLEYAGTSLLLATIRANRFRKSGASSSRSSTCLPASLICRRRGRSFLPRRSLTLSTLD